MSNFEGQWAIIYWFHTNRHGWERWTACNYRFWTEGDAKRWAERQNYKRYEIVDKHLIPPLLTLLNG